MAEDGYKVVLNVYDLSQGLARQLSTTFLGKAIEGIWHTGVVVYGNEYYFGGGIQQDPAGRTPYGTPVKVVDLGVTHVPQDVFEQYLQEISPLYTAERYNLLQHNCNNFSNEIAQFLVGVTIPDYILQLPNEVMNSPMGALIMPMIQNLEATLRAGAVPQAPQFRNSSINQPSSAATTAAVKVTNNEVKSEGSKALEKSATPAVKPADPAKNKVMSYGVAGDPLGDARSKLQEEISAEFQRLMCTGALRASEAATLAARTVMEKYKNPNVSAQQS